MRFAGEMTKPQMMDEILRLKRERKAIILSHLYQRGEIQDLADYVGDSLGLSQEAAKTDAEVIVFCGVHFMAETAAMLSPDKIVLLPEEEAGCPMANMITVQGLRDLKEKHPNAVVVAYVNTSAAVKAEADICCTSSNAVKVLESIDPDREIIFVPDIHLARYAAQKANRKVIPWKGFCPTHNWVSTEEIKRAKADHPTAKILAHPECREEVVALADAVSSTTGMINFARKDPATEFIVVTESGILHQLRKQLPGKSFFLASEDLVCPNMKATTLEKVLWSLQELKPRITVPAPIREKAVKALDRMLALS